MSPEGMSAAANSAPEQEASGIFIQRLYGDWDEADQTAFERRLASDRAFAQAYRRVEESWRALDRHAEAAELMTYRAEAIDIVRRANARRWFPRSPVRWLAHQWKIAAAAAGLVASGLVWQLSPYGYGNRSIEYHTSIAEQRVVELEDHTHVAIDATTRLQVRFTSDARSVRLLEGQVQFSVSKDSSRPFKVIAGGRTIVAIGTEFTVEYVDHRLNVAMVEGKVAVLTPKTRAGETPSATEIATRLRDGEVARTSSRQDNEEIYLTAGEELRVALDGRPVVTPKADLEAATAWREGKVIFHTTPLGEAVNRMNRYSRLQLRIDDEALATQYVSGVFEAGDTLGFVNALQRLLPVTADYSDPETVRLKLRHTVSSTTTAASAAPR
jgi:transmembrane sensor